MKGPNERESATERELVNQQISKINRENETKREMLCSLKGSV